MYSTDIKEVRYNGNEVAALYKGSTLIYRKADEVPYNLLAGSFTQSNWYGYDIKINTTSTYTINTDDDGSFYDLIPEIWVPFTSCYRMFYKQDRLKTITAFPDTSTTTNMGGLFWGCTNLSILNLSKFDTSSATNMNSFMRDCGKVEVVNLNKFNTSKVTDMCYMFSGCAGLKELNLSKFNTSKVTDMRYMFSGCAGLKELDLSTFDTSNVTMMDYMFANCTGLQELDLSSFNTSNVTKIDYMFNENQFTKLIFKELDFSKASHSDYNTYTFKAFYGCTKLANVTGTMKNIRYGFDLRWCPLTNESAMVFINGLANNISSQTTMTFGTATYNTLSPEQIAIATSKGCTIARVSV